MKQRAAIFICDESGIMALPWAENGYTCVCVDVQHPIRSTTKGTHRVLNFAGGGCIHFVYGDARSWKPTDFDMNFNLKYTIAFVACFPVCTNLAGSGAQDWPRKGLAMLCDGLLLFNSCHQIADWSGAPYMIENPAGAIPQHHRKADYTFHPWHYGDDYQKLTCLWTGNGFVMPEKQVTVKPENVTQKIWLASPGPERQKERSKTPQGFARAVFEANGTNLLNQKSA
jgi:hypothetical protein